jgi:RNA polymerase sigma-70 factor (ECF subfamily)
MNREDVPECLNQISTVWPVVRQAHLGLPVDAALAQQQLMERYGKAVHAYLLRLLRDPHAADDLTQEFGLRLVRGGFKRADPQHGRFRDYVRTTLAHLVNGYHKKQQRQPRSLAEDAPEREDPERQFLESWRAHLLARAWDELALAQPALYAVLRLKADQPELTSAEMAEQLGRGLLRPLTADGVRQVLHRARVRLANLLFEEVARSLNSPKLEDVEEELRELGLLRYCRPALDRYARTRPGA